MSLEALAMGGYGVFVWGSFGLGLAVCVWNLVAPFLQRRGLIENLADSAEE